MKKTRKNIKYGDKAEMRGLSPTEGLIAAAGFLL
jgi:hypothetical protein